MLVFLRAKVFIVKVKLDEFSWVVYRRFRQFRELGDKVGAARMQFPYVCDMLWAQLKRVLPQSATCPPRRVFTSHTPAFLEGRRIELLEWIRKGCVRPTCISISSRGNHLPNRYSV